MGKKKEIKKYDKYLRKCQKNRDLVKINRTVTEGEADIYGVIFEFSDELMQLAEVKNFKFDGEVIIRMDHYDSIRSNAFDETCKQILIAEKQLSKAKPKWTKLNLSSWNSVCKELKKMDFHVIVECEDLKKPTFIIGPIEKINTKSVEIRNYDATGKLDKKRTKIKFKNITLLKFADEYSTTFRKYLKEPKSKMKNSCYASN